MTKDFKACEKSHRLSKFNDCSDRLKLKDLFSKFVFCDQSNRVSESSRASIWYFFKFDVRSVRRLDRRKHFYRARNKESDTALKKVLLERLNISLSTFALKISSHHYHSIFIYVYTRRQLMQCQISFDQSFTMNERNRVQQNLLFSTSFTRQFLTHHFFSNFFWRFFRCRRWNEKDDILSISLELQSSATISTRLSMSSHFIKENIDNIFKHIFSLNSLLSVSIIFRSWSSSSKIFIKNIEWL